MKVLIDLCLYRFSTVYYYKTFILLRLYRSEALKDQDLDVKYSYRKKKKKTQDPDHPFFDNSMRKILICLHDMDLGISISCRSISRVGL